MKYILLLVCALLLSLASPGIHATTWGPKEVRDPISETLIKVAEPMSSGSYIYQWPSKTDLVFWPHTDQEWLWFNPKSGYIGFGHDFEKIEPERVVALKAWLKANYRADAPPKSRLELLAWAEKVYTIRGMGDGFWSHFYRLMAFETRASKEISLGYVKKAVPLLQKRLDAAAELGPKLENLYLLSEYNRRLGNEADSNNYLAQLNALEVDEKLSDFKRYVLTIAEEQRYGPKKKAESAEDKKSAVK